MTWRALAALLLGAAVLVACGPDSPRDPFEDADFEPTEGPELGPPPEEVDLPDTRGVVLEPVPGFPEEPDPVRVYGGEAVLQGRVSGPDGDAGGAVVRLERFVGLASDSVEVAVRSDGTYRARRLNGGRYRVRAYRAPDLAMLSSQVFFLPADADEERDLNLGRFGGTDLQAELLAGTLEVGQSARLVALAQEVAVDGDGIVRGVPLAGQDIAASGGADWRVEGASQTVPGDGFVEWVVTCVQPGSTPIRVVVADDEVVVAARCRAPAPTTTAPPSDPAPTAVVAVGARFTPPIPGPVAPGRYEVVESSGTCTFTYEPYVDGRWLDQRASASGTQVVVLPVFARDLQPLGGATPCTYERVS